MNNEEQTATTSCEITSQNLNCECEMKEKKSQKQKFNRK